jgi:branched-chain amino acid transport system substrate-binding protein
MPHSRSRLQPAVSALLCAGLLLLASPAARAGITIGLMVSATGPTSAIGIPQRNTGELLPRTIGGERVRYVSLEDGGDATRAVQNVRKLIEEDHIDALIGPSTTPNAFAILDVIAEHEVPMMATVGTATIAEPVDAKRRWVFKTTQNDDLIAAALLAHMRKTGVRSVGMIGFNDPYGENWFKVFGAMADKAGIRVTGIERYARTDQSVTGQVLKLVAAHPDAILVAAVGGPAVLPQATLFDRGYQGRVYQTHAVATEDFIKLGQQKVEGTILAAGPMLVIDEIPAANPTKQVAQAYIDAYRARFGAVPATFGANTWDAWLLLERAIPAALASARPGSEAFRVALRDALERQHEVVGCQGVFDMSPTNHNGMDERARVLVTVRGGRFRLLAD